MIKKELEIQSQRQNHIDTVKDYIRKNCDRKGEIKDGENLTASEKEGKRQIEEGIMNKGWILYKTDKSGRMCLDTVTNYIECMQEHVRKDTVVTPDRVREGELIMNNHSRSWVRLANIGGGHNHE